MTSAYLLLYAIKTIILTIKPVTQVILKEILTLKFIGKLADYISFRKEQWASRKVETDLRRRTDQAIKIGGVSLPRVTANILVSPCTKLALFESN